MNQQHFPSHEPAHPAEGLFCAQNKATNRVDNERLATPITIGRVQIVPIAWLEQI